jgi:ABC-2 type transport system permease protein
MSVFQAKALYIKEIACYFAQPSAYLFIFMFLVLTNVYGFYLGGFIEGEQASLAIFFSIHPFVYMLLIPALTMSSWAQERQQGTIELLMTMGVKPGTILLAKYFAILTLVLIALLASLPLVVSVRFLGQMDYGSIFSSYLGSFLLASSFTALGLAVSAITKSQVVSYLLALLVNLVFVLVGHEQLIQALTLLLPELLVHALSQVSLLYYYQDFIDGLISWQGLNYFIIFTCSYLAMSLLIIDYKKAD